MHAFLIRLAHDLHGCWRFRWISLAVAWAICVAGWTYVYRMSDVYEASTRVYVDSKGALGTLLQGMTVDPNASQQLHYVRQLLLSRPQLEHVARQAELGSVATTPAAMERLVNSLQKRITIAVDSLVPYSSSDGVYKISFQDTNRARSLAVVQTLTTNFMTLSRRQEGEVEAKEFITKQIEELDKQLAEADLRRTDFRRRHEGTLPGEGGDYYGNIMSAQMALDTATADLKSAETRRQEFENQLSGEEPVLFGLGDVAEPSGGTDTNSDVGVQLRVWKKKLADLRTRYQEKYFEVVEAKQKVAELEAAQKAELDRLRRGMRASGDLAQSAKANPVYQSLQIDKNKTNVQIAELNERIKLQTQMLNELKRRRGISGEVATQLDQMNRDYDQLKGKQQALVNRLAAVKFSEDADRAQPFKFKLFDPPSVPLTPVGPNRAKYLTAILLLALAAGGGLAFLLSSLRPVFHDVRTLAQNISLPVLGSVSRVWDASHKLRQRSQLTAFSGGFVLLLVAFGVVMFLKDVRATRLIG